MKIKRVLSAYNGIANDAIASSVSLIRPKHGVHTMISNHIRQFQDFAQQNPEFQQSKPRRV